MSDGISDANALGRLDRDVMLKAHDLRNALKAAEEGHRGLRPAGILATANNALKGCGFQLVREPGHDRGSGW